MPIHSTIKGSYPLPLCIERSFLLCALILPFLPYAPIRPLSRFFMPVHKSIWACSFARLLCPLSRVFHRPCCLSCNQHTASTWTATRCPIYSASSAGLPPSHGCHAHCLEVGSGCQFKAIKKRGLLHVLRIISQL